jgi:hypothetical protein
MSSSQEELLRLYETPQVSSLVPQVATAAPLYPAEGMIRYAKSPWNPLGTGEAWVSFIDGSWTLFNAEALDGKANTNHGHTTSEIAGFSEAVDDRVATLLSAGSNISLTYNDAGDALTIALTTSPNVSGSLSDSKGNVRDLPVSNRTAAYTAALSDTGGQIRISTGGVTIPADVFLPGHVFSIVNNSASNQTITQGAGVTLRLAGTATTGNRTLAQYGQCTVNCVASNEFIISGPGLT